MRAINFIARHWERLIPLTIRRVIYLIFWMVFLYVVPMQILHIVTAGA